MNSLVNENAENLKKNSNIQFLTFKVDNEEYGVDIMLVREIKGWTETTRLPNSPKYMRGVTNLRGIIVPIFDLRTKFTGELTEPTVNHVVIIFEVYGKKLGILVDSVSDILEVNESEIKPSSEMEQQSRSDFISGLISVDQRMVIILKIDQVFDKKSLENCSKSEVA